MLRTSFILAIFALGLPAACLNQFVALLFYLWFAFFRPQEYLWIDITTLRLSLVLGVILIVPCLFKGIVPDFRHPVGAGVIAFLAVVLLGAPSAMTPGVTWHWVDYFVRVSLVSLFAMRLIRTPKQLSATIAVVALSIGCYTAKSGFVFLVGGGVRSFDGLAGAFVDSNGYALAATMVMFLLIGVGQNIRSRLCKYGLFACAGLSAFTVIGTFSREGFLALVAAILTFVLLQRRRSVALVGLLGCLLITLWLVPLPEGYVDRLYTIKSYEEVRDESAMSRLHFWRVAVDMAVDHPVLGVGLRGYDAAYDMYDFLYGQYGHARSVHNSHLQVLAETGLVGLTVWIWILANTYLSLLRVRNRSRELSVRVEESRFLFTMANAMVSSITAFVIGGSFIALALNDLIWIMFAFVVALDRLSITALVNQSETATTRMLTAAA